MRIGVDVGGTFTDAVVVGEDGAGPRILKVPSTGSTASTISALAEIAEGGKRGTPFDYVAHGSTVATNTIIERTGPRLALLTTEGFVDVLELKRLGRPGPLLYDLFLTSPPPLIPRELRIGIRERVDSAGSVREPLDERSVIDAVERLRHSGVTSVAVCFLFSFLEPAHERRTREILEDRLPGAVVTLSSDVLPEFREYERTATTVLHAYLKPVIASYLASLQNQIRDEAGIACPVYALQSNGGLTSPAVAVSRPATMALSGPSGGVVAASDLGSRLGIPDLITVDMGGTSFDVALVRGGAPVKTQERRILDQPVRFPMVDIHTIGAGGGSVAWVDEAGGLRVGPRSAGSRPGPVCYGQGGTEPTVTDANVVLGMLSTLRPMGGAIRLRGELARRACGELGDRLGLSDVATAAGIRRIVNTAMAGAIRAMTVKRGHDPRDFTLLAYGGAGPLHACDLLEELDIPWLVVPEVPGCFSALGAITADVSHDYVRSVMAATDAIDDDELEVAFDALTEAADRDMSVDGIPRDRRKAIRRLEMRYTGQNFSLIVDLPARPDASSLLVEAVGRFHEAHEAAYGFSTPDGDVQIVNVRLEASGILKKTPIRGFDYSDIDALEEEREVHFTGHGAVNTPVRLRSAFSAGDTTEGPLVIEQADTTIVVPPGRVLTVVDSGILVIGARAWR
jgi:N-methylhydantoinase A